MTQPPIHVLLMVSLSVLTLSNYAQTPSHRSRHTPASDSAIRRIDFRNFTYRSTLCAQELGSEGIGTTVRVRNGQFKNADVYYTAGKAVYGDLTADGRDEAVVVIDCNENVANFSVSEIHIYGVTEGKVGLLTSFDDRQMERDYYSYYPRPEGELWRITGLRVSGEVSSLSDSQMAR